MVQIYISPLTVSECSFSLWKYIYVCSQWNGTLLSAGLLVACVAFSGFWRPVFVLCVCWTVKWWLARAHKLGILSSYLKWMTHSERKHVCMKGCFWEFVLMSHIVWCMLFLYTYVLTFSQNAFDFGFSSIYLNTLKYPDWENLWSMSRSYFTPKWVISLKGKVIFKRKCS